MDDMESMDGIEGDVLEGLNKAQLDAVTTTEGFVRVLAGAGSGKTRALVHRFAYLTEELGILPGNILCVTFTNKAAGEMRSRIHQMTGDNDTGYIHTFHGFCVSVLQEDSYAVGFPKNFLVLDNSDIDDMLAIIYEERHLTLRDMTYGQARDMFEMRKCIDQPRYYLDLIQLSVADLKAKYDAAEKKEDILFYGYLYQQKKCFGLDYNDLIKFTLYIFHEHADIRLKWQQRLEYIMIDEFQDIDQLQYELMDVLAAYHKNLFVVGDPDQTIYTWRGASGRFLMDFDMHYAGTKTIYMMENYRSTPQILAAVNSLIARNRDRIKKDLISMRADGPRPLYHHAGESAGEGHWLADTVKKLHEEEDIAYRDIVVLYRAHYVTRSLEEQLLGAKIPYTIYSGVQFFGRKEVRDAIAYLRMIAYGDDLSFARVVNTPKRNIGKRRMTFLQEYVDEHGGTLYEAMRATQDHAIWHGTQAQEFLALIDRYARSYEGQLISDVLTHLLDESGYEAMLRTEGSQERLDNLAELKQSVRDYETDCGEEAGLMDYLAHIALFTNRDAGDPGDKIRLMTVHTAKGLEFPIVFLCGMSEGIFPSRKTRTKEGLEEERRLAFVAMTRAEDRLYLSDAEGLNYDGSVRFPSRFLFDIGKDYLDIDEPLPESLVKGARHAVQASDRQMQRRTTPAAYAVGTRVMHRIFGVGTIQALDDEKHAYVIAFDTLDTPRSISYQAKLTKED